jgi:hypothetical protein
VLFDAPTSFVRARPLALLDAGRHVLQGAQRHVLRGPVSARALIGLVLLTGCGGVLTPGIGLHLPAASHYDLWLDPDLSPESRAAATAAAAQWMKFTPVQITLHEGTRICIDDCFSVHEVQPTSLVLLEGEYIGMTIPGVIFLASKLDVRKLDETAIHELGHALGLQHRPKGTNAVMVGDYADAAKHVTCDDVKQFEEERAGSTGPSVFVAPCTDVAGALP